MKVILFFECTEVGIQLPCRGYVYSHLLSTYFHLDLIDFTVLCWYKLQFNYLQCQHENCKSNQIGYKNMLPLPWPLTVKSESPAGIGWWLDMMMCYCYTTHTNRCHFNNTFKCHRPFLVLKGSDVVVEFLIPIYFKNETVIEFKYMNK